MNDIHRLHGICSDTRVMRFVGDGRIWSRERTSQFIQSATTDIQQHGYCQWPVIHSANLELIGYCGFVKGDNGPEIGWRLAPEYWGQGLATEAARVVLNHGFRRLGFSEVVATVQAKNAASIRIVEKLAMTLKQSFDRDGREVRLYAARLD